MYWLSWSKQIQINSYNLEREKSAAFCFSVIHIIWKKKKTSNKWDVDLLQIQTLQQELRTRRLGQIDKIKSKN